MRTVVIGFQSGGHLITGSSSRFGESVRRLDCTCLKNHTVAYTQPTQQPVGISWVVVARRRRRRRRDETRRDETRRDETRRDRWRDWISQEGKREREREKATSLLEAEPRAYDIKHYNYYLNSSRIAPGVAALLFSRLLLFSILLWPANRPTARPPTTVTTATDFFFSLLLSMHSALDVWPRTDHALFALSSRRIPVAHASPRNPFARFDSLCSCSARA